MRLSILCFLSVLLFNPGCDFWNDTTDKGVVIARVHDSYLYEKDIVAIFPDYSSFSFEDSILLRENYIKSWVKNQLFFQKALRYLRDDQKDKDKELNDYYESLIRFEFENEIIRQNLDSNVSREEISDFYENNLEKFDLKSNIIRGTYVKVEKGEADLALLRSLYSSDSPEDMEEYHVYAVQYAETYHLDDKQWMYLDRFSREVPVEYNDPNAFLENNKNFELDAGDYVYFVNIIDYRLTNEPSPIELEYQKIKNVILSKRRINLIKQLENQVMQDGYENRHYEIYE